MGAKRKVSEKHKSALLAQLIYELAAPPQLDRYTATRLINAQTLLTTTFKVSTMDLPWCWFLPSMPSWSPGRNSFFHLASATAHSAHFANLAARFSLAGLLSIASQLARHVASYVASKRCLVVLGNLNSLFLPTLEPIASFLLSLMCSSNPENKHQTIH